MICMYVTLLVLQFYVPLTGGVEVERGLTCSVGHLTDHVINLDASLGKGAVLLGGDHQDSLESCQTACCTQNIPDDIGQGSCNLVTYYESDDVKKENCFYIRCYPMSVCSYKRADGFMVARMINPHSSLLSFFRSFHAVPYNPFTLLTKSFFKKSQDSDRLLHDLTSKIQDSAHITHVRNKRADKQDEVLTNELTSPRLEVRSTTTEENDKDPETKEDPVAEEGTITEEGRETIEDADAHKDPETDKEELSPGEREPSEIDSSDTQAETPELPKLPEEASTEPASSSKVPTAPVISSKVPTAPVISSKVPTEGVRSSKVPTESASNSTSTVLSEPGMSPAQSSTSHLSTVSTRSVTSPASTSTETSTSSSSTISTTVTEKRSSTSRTTQASTSLTSSPIESSSAEISSSAEEEKQSSSSAESEKDSVKDTQTEAPVVTSFVTVTDILDDVESLSFKMDQRNGVLVLSLGVGMVLMAVVLLLLGKRWYEVYQRRHYNKVNYLINGMYN